MRLSKSQHFWRYLFSYLSLAILPLIMVILFYISNFARKFEQEIILNVEKDSYLVVNQIDNHIHTLGQIANQTMISAPLLTQTNQFDPNTVNELKSFLSIYTSTNSFLHEIYVTLGETGYVANSTTTSDLFRLTEKYYLSDQKTPAEMAELFTCKVPGIESVGALHTPFSAAREAIFFIYPLTPYPARASETIVFEVDYDTINKLIRDNLEMYQAQVWVMNQGNQKIGNFGILHEDVTKEYQALTSDEEFPSIDGFEKRYIISRISSTEGLQYIIFVPRTQAVFDKLYHMNIVFVFSIIVIMIICGVTVTHLLHTQYVPLHRIHEQVQHLVSSGKSSNIIKDLDFAVAELRYQNDSLSANFEKNIDLIKNERLHMLLMGRYATLEDFNLDCQEVNIQFREKFLFVSVTSIQFDLCSIDEIGQLFKSNLQGLCQSYYLYSFSTRRIIMIHNVSSPKYYSAVSQKIFSISKTFMAGKGTLTTGVGSCIHNIEDIYRSYYEATAALEYSFIRGDGTVITFEETNQTDVATRYPEQQFEKLKNAIASGNEPVINECIDETVELMQSGKYPLSMIKGMCFTLVHIATSLPENKPVRFVDGVPRIKIEDIESLIDLTQKIKNWRQKYVVKMVDFKDETSHFPVQEVYSYLDAHCLSCDFSINQTAEYFGMSLSKFSQCFKEETGQNVLDYTIRFRLNEAKKLLGNTNDSLNDIAAKIGYYNTSSFIRRFKQVNGVTPGEYRKNYHRS